MKKALQINGAVFTNGDIRHNFLGPVTQRVKTAQFYELGWQKKTGHALQCAPFGQEHQAIPKTDNLASTILAPTYSSKIGSHSYFFYIVCFTRQQFPLTASRHSLAVTQIMKKAFEINRPICLLGVTGQ